MEDEDAPLDALTLAAERDAARRAAALAWDHEARCYGLADGLSRHPADPAHAADPAYAAGYAEGRTLAAEGSPEGGR